MDKRQRKKRDAEILQSIYATMGYVDSEPPLDDLRDYKLLKDEEGSWAPFEKVVLEREIERRRAQFYYESKKKKDKPECEH